MHLIKFLGNILRSMFIFKISKLFSLKIMCIFPLKIYNETTKHLIQPVLKGFNATVFAYGPTVYFFSNNYYHNNIKI